MGTSHRSFLDLIGLLAGGQVSAARRLAARRLTVPQYTGCTAAGLASGMRAQDKLLVFPAAPYGVNLESIQSLVQQILPEIQIFQDYIFGGFAKFPAPLLDFARKFESDFGIQLDPIYSAKMMYGVLDLIEKHFFPEESVIVALHTGGLQGWRGVKE